MKKEITTETKQEIKEKSVSKPVRMLVASFFVIVAFLLAWFMPISFLVAPLFLLIMVVLSIVYYKKDQWIYLVILPLLVVGYFLIVLISFPHCDFRSSATFIGYDYKTSCECLGIRKYVRLGKYESKTQCMGVRKKCYKHPYDSSIADRRRVEIPCSDIESALRGMGDEEEALSKEHIKTLLKLDYKRGTHKELEKYQASENFINIESIDNGISFFAVYEGRDCINEEYSVWRNVAERTVIIMGQGLTVCKKEVVNRIVKGTIVNLQPGKYKFKLDYIDPGPEAEKGIWPKKLISKTVLESEFEVE